METISSIIPEEVEEKIERTQDFEDLPGGKVRKKPKRHSGKGYEERSEDSFPTSKKELAELKTPPIEYEQSPNGVVDEFDIATEYEPASNEQLDVVSEMNREVEERQAEKIDFNSPLKANGRIPGVPNTENEKKAFKEAKKEKHFGRNR